MYMCKSPYSSSFDNTKCTKQTLRTELLKLLFNCLLWRLDTPEAAGFQYHGHCLYQQSEKELFPEARKHATGQEESEIRSPLQAGRNTIG